MLVRSRYKGSHPTARSRHPRGGMSFQDGKVRMESDGMQKVYRGDTSSAGLWPPARIAIGNTLTGFTFKSAAAPGLVSYACESAAPYPDFEGDADVEAWFNDHASELPFINADFGDVDGPVGAGTELPCEEPSGGGGGCPELEVWVGDYWLHENTILARSVDGSSQPDYYPIRVEPNPSVGNYRFRIRELETEYTAIENVRLTVIDFSPYYEPFLLGDQVKLGTVQRPWRVTAGDGSEITHLLLGKEHGFYPGASGETLLVEMYPKEEELRRSVSRYDFSTSGLGGLVVTSGGKEITPDSPVELLKSKRESASDPQLLDDGMVDQAYLESTGVLVQGLARDGNWTNIDRIYPREELSQTILNTGECDAYRLILVGRHRIGRVGLMRVVDAPLSVTVMSPTLGMHSRLGIVTSELTPTSGSRVYLEPGDALELHFSELAPKEGMTRNWALLIQGGYSFTIPEGLRSLGDSPVLDFTLGLIYPMPAAGEVRIGYTLPATSDVSISIFDAAGRNVRSLVSERQGPGRHEATWDRLDRGGSAVSPGVYFCRIRAGSRQEECWHPIALQRSPSYSRFPNWSCRS